MTEHPNMSAPVTRAELREELADFARKSDLADLKSDLADFARKSDLADFARKSDLADFARKSDLADLKSDLTDFARKSDLAALRQELVDDFAHIARSLMEHLSSLIAPVDEKYKDLPPRVTRLEEAVFSPAPRSTRPRKRRAG
jgi:hypothetical protein